VKEFRRLWREADPEKDRAASRRWYKANPEKSNERNRRWRKENAEQVKEKRRRKYEADPEKQREAKRLWRKENPEKNKENIRRWHELQMKTNVQYKLGFNLRGRLSQAIKGNFKSGSAVADLGCTIAELKLHLERQFDAHMNWGNYGKYWSIDHINPLASFDLTDREQFLRAVHWTNLQPLEKVENMRKGARILGRVEEFDLAA